MLAVLYLFGVGSPAGCIYQVVSAVPKDCYCGWACTSVMRPARVRLYSGVGGLIILLFVTKNDWTQNNIRT